MSKQNGKVADVEGTEPVRRGARRVARRAARQPGDLGEMRRRVRQVLRRYPVVSAEQLLVALTDLMVDEHVQRDLVERGLAPERFDVGGRIGWVSDVLQNLQGAAHDAMFEFGKGYGRQPARGTAEEARAERAAWWNNTSGDTCSPIKRALRDVLSYSSLAAQEYLHRAHPPEEWSDEEDEQQE
jgi:hypothetical protein